MPYKRLISFILSFVMLINLTFHSGAPAGKAYAADAEQNLAADLESKEDIDALLKKLDIPGKIKDAVLCIAESQIGYAESETNYIVDGDAEFHYSRYGQWFDMPYAEWDSLFVLFCICNALHCEAADVLWNASTNKWIKALEKSEYLTEPGEKLASGDIVFFKDGDLLTVGILQMSGEEDPSSDVMRCIHRDGSGSVAATDFEAKDIEHLLNLEAIYASLTQEETPVDEAAAEVPSDIDEAAQETDETVCQTEDAESETANASDTDADDIESKDAQKSEDSEAGESGEGDETQSEETETDENTEVADDDAGLDTNTEQTETKTSEAANVDNDVQSGDEDSANDEGSTDNENNDDQDTEHGEDPLNDNTTVVDADPEAGQDVLGPDEEQEPVSDVEGAEQDADKDSNQDDGETADEETEQEEGGLPDDTVEESPESDGGQDVLDTVSEQGADNETSTEDPSEQPGEDVGGSQEEFAEPEDGVPSDDADDEVEQGSNTEQQSEEDESLAGGADDSAIGDEGGLSEETTDAEGAPADESGETVTEGAPEESAGQEEPEDQAQEEDVSDVDEPAEEAAEIEHIIFDERGIHIYNFEQLRLIGSNKRVKDSDWDPDQISKGKSVTDDSGKAVKYALDAKYYFENDILFPDGEVWSLPENFSGSFDGNFKKADTKRLFDENTDTIYIQNSYELMAINVDNRDELPLISGDIDINTFGIGNIIFPSDESAGYVTYSGNHHYVLSASFTTVGRERVKKLLGGPLKAPSSGNTNDDLINGRDWFGQPTVDIDGTTYILIGDRQQLDAINDATTTNTTNVYGPVYAVQQTYTRTGTLKLEWVDNPDTAVLVYPGDADLVSDVWTGEEQVDFSEKKLFGRANVGHILSGDDRYDYRDLGTEGGNLIVGSTRIVYCATDWNGGYDTSKHSNNDNRVSATLTYAKNGNYIVFRDIDMQKTDAENKIWKPLTFTGTMYGVKAENDDDVSTLWDANKTALQIDTDRKPIIHDFTVEPKTLTQLGQVRLDLNEQSGVGFFSTLSGDHSSSSIIVDPVVVKNIRLENGVINNMTTKADIDQSVVNLLLVGLGTALGLILDPVLKLLLSKDVGVREMLLGLLNARAKDPSSLATGAFAGRIIGDAIIEDCEVSNMSVNTIQTEYEQNGKIVGKGGFVGYVEGETKYDTLSLLVGGVGDALSGVLNLIPGVGLGDLIKVLLDNALPLKNLIPTGYNSPVLTRCVADDITLSTESGKYGVGGFAGSACGTIMTDCSLTGSDVTVNADFFGGGFIGVIRDAIIKGTLTDLGVDIGSLHPQSEMIRCNIVGSDVHSRGVTYIGGFAGAMLDSYAINCSVDETSTIDVDATGNYVGGFTGLAHLGTVFDFGSYLEESDSLLSTVKGLVTGLLGNGSDQSLLDVGGVAPSAIMGLQMWGPVSVESDGAFVGGIVGRGNGVLITSSSPENLRKLGKYDTMRNGVYRDPLPISPNEERNNYVHQLVSVNAGHGIDVYEEDSFVGGIAGYLTSANIGGLLGDTAGVGQYLGFTLCDTTVEGVADGYTVYGDGEYVGGGIGWAVGGDVYDTDLQKLGSVSGNNHAGGFVGATGPGDLVNGSGLDLTLLGIQLISIDNLLSLVSGVRTTYENVDVVGVESGFTVEERGLQENGDQREYVAGGFAGEANSVRIVDGRVKNLLSVTANMQDGAAGGFVGASSAGGLAGVAKNNDTLSVAQIGNLVNAVPYLVPSYDGCDVTYVDSGFVMGDTAGGYAGDFQSGKVNTYSVDGINPIRDDDDPERTNWPYEVGTVAVPWAVNNIHHVRGGNYAGGFGGKVYSGALVSAGGGLSVLGGMSNISLNVQDLLSVASGYVPIIKYAGVNTWSNTQKGFTVLAAQDYGADGSPATEGHAGGFIGYGSGVQVSYSDVNKLRHGNVTEPNPLEGKDGSSYMVYGTAPDEIPYAVAGAEYAGGYIGYMDVGTAASLGGGLKLLGNSISLTNVLDALSVVVSTIEHSDVYGAPGGFNVLATSHALMADGQYDSKGIGYSGGYAGKISGGHIQDGNVELFYYIVGEIAAGGYAGEAEPGDAAKILNDESSLSLLGNVNSLASLVQDFVPTIRNSQTTCVPCGGAVRAQCFSDGLAEGNVVRGMAGGYIGHAKGAQIWGMDSHVWKEQNSEADLLGKMTRGAYTGEKRECAAIRIRSVYGAEYAGGYAGLMECGSTAQTGGLSLLGGLISADNLLGALNAVYPTVHYGAVYGPLEGIDEATWNAWKQYVGAYGGFSSELAKADFDELENFIYGYHVVAGRDEYDPYTTTVLSGCAGGFVGSMHSGSIKNSHAEDAKLVTAMRSAGGFAGEMQTKGLAEFGSVNLLGDALNLNLGNLVKVADVFVPSISDSGTNGYQRGLTVQAFGDKQYNGVGCAGGYVGAAYGAQLGIEHEIEGPSVWIRGLKSVKGTNTVGGFVGKTAAASVLNADTSNASSGFLQKVLDKLISTPNSLVDVLNATLTTIKHAEVDASDSEWGLVVEGDDANFTGGFAGSLEAVVVGERNKPEDTIVVNNLRSVKGGYYAGGFFGLADVGSVAQVGGDDGTGTNTNILDLIQAGNISVLDAFRTYVYHATVNGVPDGITVTADKYNGRGTMSTYQESGAAGGFGGGLMNGTVENSVVNGVNTVTAPNYSAGFIGYMGKNGGVSVDEAKITDDSVIGKLLSALGLDLGANAQLLNIVGSTVKNCSASGISRGMVVQATRFQHPIAGTVSAEDITGACAAGFTGFADISQIDNCTVDNLKLVKSPQVAAGFIGRSSMAYIADIDVSSGLTAVIVKIVNALVKILYLDELSNLDLLSLELPSDLLGLKLLSDGDLLYVNLLGLKIGVSLLKNDPEYNSDAVMVTIGSSTIKLPCDEDGIKGETPDLTINLFEGNRTSVKNSTVTGITRGYDVFAGGSAQDKDPVNSEGFAGGFIGYNNNGFLSHNRMWLCDIVKGNQGEIGPFTGYTKANTRPVSYLEGTDNMFSIYRSSEPSLTEADTENNEKIADALDDTIEGTRYNRYDVTHLAVIKNHEDLARAYEKGSGMRRNLNAYTATSAKLMLDLPVTLNPESETVAPDELKDPCEEEFDLHVNKKWRDYGNLLNTRPDSITIKVYQVDAGKNPPNNLVVNLLPESGGEVINTYLLTLEPNENSEIHWRGVLEGLPIAYMAEVEQDGQSTEELHYYQYVVEELPVEGYEMPQYEVIESTASVTIINTYKDLPLPNSGGAGTSIYLQTGFMMFVVGIALALNAKRKRIPMPNKE